MNLQQLFNVLLELYYYFDFNYYNLILLLLI